MERNENRAKGWLIAIGFSALFYTVVSLGAYCAILYIFR